MIMAKARLFALVFAAAALFTLLSSPAFPQSVQRVFDAHWHLPAESSYASEVEAIKALNVVGAVAIGTQVRFESMKPDAQLPVLRALTFPCEKGGMVNNGVKCFASGKEFPDLRLRREAVKNGDITAFGELNAEYLGIAPNDPRLEPYYTLAEEFDVPVGIHLGIGPPGVAYAGPGFPPVKSINYRGTAGSPLLLEDVLVKHPRLRLYVMHAAYPFRDDMIYMLYMHPRLFVDVSVLQWAVPRAAYYGYLKELVDAGFGKRIMFGSDGSSKRLKEGIEAVNVADFLSPAQRSDIFYENAARFFKLPSTADNRLDRTKTSGR